MDTIGQALSFIAGLGTLICFIMVLIQMFQRGQTVLGIVCIVLGCCGIGEIIAFVYGWVKHREWGLTNVMIIWSVCWVISAVGYGMHPINIQQFQQQFPGQ